HAKAAWPCGAAGLRAGEPYKENPASAGSPSVYSAPPLTPPLTPPPTGGTSILLRPRPPCQLLCVQPVSRSSRLERRPALHPAAGRHSRGADAFFAGAAGIAASASVQLPPTFRRLIVQLLRQLLVGRQQTRIRRRRPLLA